MDENYSEYAVSVQQTPEMRLKQAGVVLLTLAAAVLAFQVHWAFLILVIAGIVGCYFAWMSMEMEYETIYLDGTLEIAAIYRKARRRKLFQCDIKQAAGYHVGKKEEAIRLGKITRDLSSHRADSVCCVMKAETAKGSHIVCFEPGEDLVRILETRYRTLKV